MPGIFGADESSNSLRSHAPEDDDEEEVEPTPVVYQRDPSELLNVQMALDEKKLYAEESEGSQSELWQNENSVSSSGTSDSNKETVEGAKPMKVSELPN